MDDSNSDMKFRKGQRPPVTFGGESIRNLALVENACQGYRGRTDRDGLDARSKVKRPSASVHSAIGDHPPARSNVRASRGPYLRQFSVWIVSPSAMENDSPATVN